MTNLKNRMVQAVRHKAAQNLADFAGAYVRAQPEQKEQKEQIQAAIDFERWLAETCRECLDQP